MSRSFAKTLALGILLIVSAVGLARPRPARGGEIELRITVWVYNYARIPLNELARAEGEAAGILRRAGVETVWLDCPLSAAEVETYPACSHPVGPTVFCLNIVPDSMAQRFGFPKATMGFALVSSHRTGGECFVFYGWVERLGELPDPPRHSILAHAVAHEMGHLLLGTNSHFPSGIMRAHMREEDWKLVAVGALIFTRQQSRVIRAEVAARLRAEQAARIASAAPSK